MGKLLGLPEWVAATGFVVCGLAVWLGAGFIILPRAHARLAARCPSPNPNPAPKARGEARAQRGCVISRLSGLAGGSTGVSSAGAFLG